MRKLYNSIKQLTTVKRCYILFAKQEEQLKQNRQEAVQTCAGKEELISPSCKGEIE